MKDFFSFSFFSSFFILFFALFFQIRSLYFHHSHFMVALSTNSFRRRLNLQLLRFENDQYNDKSTTSNRIFHEKRPTEKRRKKRQDFFSHMSILSRKESRTYIHWGDIPYWAIFSLTDQIILQPILENDPTTLKSSTFPIIYRKKKPLL